MKPKEVPKIIVDIHEKESGLFEDLYARNLGDCTEEYLLSGDVSISFGEKSAGIEMKREHDLDNSLRENRLNNQIINMKSVYDESCLIIQDWHPHVTEFDDEYTLANKVRIHEKAVNTLNRRIITYETLTQNQSIDLIEDIIKDVVSGKLFQMQSRSVEVATDNPQIRYIAHLPHVGVQTATAILERFKCPGNAIGREALETWIDVKGITSERLAEITKIIWGD